MKRFVGLWPKTYSYLKDSNEEYKKAKGTKNCYEKKLKFEDYQKCLKSSQIINIVDYLEKMLIVLKKIKNNS